MLPHFESSLFAHPTNEFDWKAKNNKDFLGEEKGVYDLDGEFRVLKLLFFNFFFWSFVIAIIFISRERIMRLVVIRNFGMIVHVLPFSSSLLHSTPLWLFFLWMSNLFLFNFDFHFLHYLHTGNRMWYIIFFLFLYKTVLSSTLTLSLQDLQYKTEKRIVFSSQFFSHSLGLVLEMPLFTRAFIGFFDQFVSVFKNEFNERVNNKW